MTKVLITLGLVFMLSGCEAISVIGGTLAGVGSAAGMDAFEDRMEARVEWTNNRDDIVKRMLATLELEGMRLSNVEGEMDAALEMWERALDLLERFKPKFLIEKVIER